MPAVSALLSSGVSVGLLAGVVSGLLYLVVAGLRWAGEAKQQKSQWLYRQARGRFLPAAPADGALEPYNGDGMEPDYVKVREFIERLVESMVLGELDNVCIKRLHAHPEYKHMAEEDSPSAAHAALKQLVQQIVRDAMTLPNFRGLNHARDHDGCQSGENIDSKTYEDILATAILNKVIERYQESSASNRTNVDGNSNLLTPELMSLISTQQPKFISSVEIGVNSTRIPDDVRTVSSDECEQGFDPLSLTIEECIEEVTTVSNVEDDDNDLENDELGVDIFKSRRTPFPEYGRDIIDGLPIECPEDFRDEDDEDNDEVDSSDDDPSLQPTDVINPVDSWEKNWLFQKRRLKVGGVSQSMPVPMLVPNPSEDYRALIGDRDAEEVSDLSECSDGALEDLILAEDDDSSKNTLPSEVNTKDVCAEWIAGIQLQAPSNSPVCESNTPLDINQFSEESNSVENTQSFLLDHTSNVNSSCDDMDITEAKNIDLFKTPAEDCLSEFGQQEGEYTEDYAAVTQRQLDSLSGLSDPEVHGSSELPETPVSQQSPEPSGAPSVLNYMASTINENLQKSDVMDTKTELEERPKAGTIAEREHKKWESAPPLPNNPYSSENIYKRLNKKQPYASVSNGNISDASVEFPEVCGSPTPKKVIDQPMHIVCSPSDVDYKRYGRDYYINTAPSGKRQSKSSSLSQLQVSLAATLSVAKLEKQIQNRDVYHSSLRARNASPQFKMNPLYENVEGESVETNGDRKILCLKMCIPDMEKHNLGNDEICILNSSKPESKLPQLCALPMTNIPWQSQEELSKERSVEKALSMNTSHSSLGNSTVSERNDYLQKESFTFSESKHNLHGHVKEKGYSESGYSSSLDSLNDSCSSQLRLVPPAQPQMVESTYESLESLRRSGSLKLGKHKRKVTSPVLGGSLRLFRQHNTRSALW